MAYPIPRPSIASASVQSGDEQAMLAELEESLAAMDRGEVVEGRELLLEMAAIIRDHFGKDSVPPDFDLDKLDGGK